MKSYQNIITIDANVRFGKPCVRGMRISVYDVLSWLASNMTFAEIIQDYPELNETDILACLQYAADKENNHRIAS